MKKKIELKTKIVDGRKMIFFPKNEVMGRKKGIWTVLEDINYMVKLPTNYSEYSEEEKQNHREKVTQKVAELRKGIL